MASTAGEKELKRDWPVVSGLTAGTQKQEGRQPFLVAEKSFVPQRDLAGIR
jgi:hypothetical protein